MRLIKPLWNLAEYFNIFRWLRHNIVPDNIFWYSEILRINFVEDILGAIPHMISKLWKLALKCLWTNIELVNYQSIKKNVRGLFN